jgi:peptidyl-prolyl cis-trans isomerase D
MISIMRRVSNSFLGRVVLMLMVVGMAFWGADTSISMIRSGLGGGLATAGGRSVNAGDLDRRIETYLRNVNQQSPEPVSKADVAENGVIDQIFTMESSKLSSLGYARTLGLEATTDAVLGELATVDAFKNPLTGELDPIKYREILNSNGLTEQVYEREVSDELILRKLRGGASAAVFPLELFSGIQAKYIGEARDVAWFVLDTSGAAKPAVPTEEDVKAHYTKNLEALKQPERRVIDLVQISSEDFLHEVTVTDQEVATTYEATKSAKFSAPDQRTYVELIFADRELAKVAFGQLAAGADADQVTGVIKRDIRTGLAENVADPALRDALFGPGKQSGALFGPRELDGGWLVARLISVQPGAVKPIEEVGEQIRLELARDRARQRVYDKVEALEIAIAAGYPVARIAADVGAPVMTFQGIDKQGATENGQQVVSLMAIDGALEQAFLLGEGDSSGTFALQDGSALISVRKIIPASTPAFETVKDRVQSDLIATRLAEAAQAYAATFVDRVKSGALTLEAAAKEAKSVVELPSGPITRASAEASGLPSAALSPVFSGVAGDTFSFPNRSGDRYLVVQLRKITAPTPEELTMLSSAAASALSTTLDQDLQIAFEAEMKKSARLKVNQNALDAYKAAITQAQ